MRRHSELHWALWTKKTGPYNKPYLAGFPGIPFVPSDPVGACAWSVADDGDHDPTLLPNKFDVWESDSD